MSKPTRKEIEKLEYGLSDLFYKENDTAEDTEWNSADSDGYEPGSFNVGLADGFALALRGLLDQAFPKRGTR